MWGCDTRICLIIAAGVFISIVWRTNGPISPVADGKYFGAIFAFVQSIGPVLSNPGSFSSGQSALYRGGSGLPDMVGVFTTIGLVILIIYLNGLRVEGPVSYAIYRGFGGRFPIK